jgi:guanylate kinase
MNTVPGNLFILSAASGAGKSSLLKALVERDPQLSVAVSHTTRAPRPGERDGEHYHFVSREGFSRMIGEAAFLEHAQVFDNWYGTAEATVRDALAAGRDLVLEIDWQGARQVRTRFPDACSVFVLPPSAAVLRERLEGRGQDSAEVIGRRMRDAANEMSHYAEYDYLVVNDRFEQALDELAAVVTARHLRQASQTLRLESLLRDLLSSEPLPATESS